MRCDAKQSEPRPGEARPSYACKRWQVDTDTERRSGEQKPSHCRPLPGGPLLSGPLPIHAKQALFRAPLQTERAPPRLAGRSIPLGLKLSRPFSLSTISALSLAQPATSRASPMSAVPAPSAPALAAATNTTGRSPATSQRTARNCAVGRPPWCQPRRLPEVLA